MSNTTININGNSNDSNLVFECSNSSIVESGKQSSSNIKTKIPLKVAGIWSANFPGIGENDKVFLKDLEEISDYVLDISYLLPSLSNPNPANIIDVSNGIIEAYIVPTYYHNSENPVFQFFATTAFGMTTREHYSWIKYGGGQELYDELYEKYNIKPFLMGSSGYQFGIYSKNKINSVNDLSGWKLRMPGIAGEILKTLNVDIKSIRGSQIISELSNNNLDASEWLGPINDIDLGIPSLTNYLYPLAFNEPGTMMTFGINLDLWNSLSTSMKKLIEITCDANVLKGFTYLEYQNGKNLSLVYQDVSEVQFPDDVVDAFKTATVNYYKKKIQDLSEQPDVQNFYVRVFNSYYEFLNKQKHWSRLQNNYSDIRDLSLDLPLTK